MHVHRQHPLRRYDDQNPTPRLIFMSAVVLFATSLLLFGAAALKVIH